MSEYRKVDFTLKLMYLLKTFFLWVTSPFKA